MSKYFDAVKEGNAGQEELNNYLKDTSANFRNYISGLDSASISVKNLTGIMNGFRATQTLTAKAMTLVRNAGLKLLATLGSMAVTFAVSAAINALIKHFIELAQAEEKARDAAIDSGKELSQQTSDLDGYKSKISDLKESLDSGTLSEQEAYQARKDLLDVQDELIEKYGAEVEGVDLLNGSLETQIALLDKLSNKKASTWLNENAEAIKKAQQEMSEDKYQRIGKAQMSTDSANRMKELAAKYADQGLRVNLTQGSDENSKNMEIYITADATNAKQTISDFMDDWQNANDKAQFMSDALASSLENQMSSGMKYYQEIIDTNGTLAEQAAKAQIQLNDTWSNTYSDLTEAQETYNDAVAKNDDKAIAAALKNVKAAQDEFANTDIDNSFVQQYMQEQADQLDSATKQSFAQQALNEGFSQAAQTYKECSKNLADLNDKYKQYGNISNTNRDVLKWNTENLKKYKDVIASWKWDVGAGDYSTVEGVSNSFGEGDNAVEIAYTPMLQTDSGLVPLSANTMDEYINILVEKATDGQTGKIDADKLLALDAEGLYLEVDGVEQKISGMVAGVEGQIVDGAMLTAADVAAIAGSSAEELQDQFGATSDYVGHSMHDIQDSVLRWKTLVEDEDSFDPFKQFVESANLSEDKAEEVYKNIGLALDSIDKYGLQDIDILNIESLSKADDTLNNVTGDARKSIGAYLDLKAAAEELDIPLDTLVDTLVELGVVYSDNIKYTNEFTSSALTMAATASKAVSSVTSILNSQGTGINVDADSYSELIKDNAEYAAALQYSNGTMQLNREMAQQLTEAKVKESEAYIKVAYSQNQVKYEKVKNDLSYYTDEVRKSIEADADKLKQFDEEKAALESQSEALRDNCRSLQMQYSALMQASSAYQDWLNAQNATESGDMYDSAIEAKKSLAEGLKNGKIGTVKWQAASEFLIPDDYEGTAAEYIKKLNRYFKQASDGSDDGSGINNFITDSLKAGLMKQESDGSIKILADKTTEDFAKELKLSSDAVQSIFGEMQEYGWTFDWGSMLGDPITNYKMQLDDIKDQMADLEPDSEAWQVLDARAEELESALDGLYQRSGLDQLADTVQQAKDNGTELSESAQQAADALDSAARVQNELDIYDKQQEINEQQQNLTNTSDFENLAKLNQEMTELLQKRQQLGGPTDTEIELYLNQHADANGDIPSDVIDKMKKAGVIKVDTEADKSQLEQASDELDALNGKAKTPVKVTVNSSDAMTKINNLGTAIANLIKDYTINIKVNQSSSNSGSSGKNKKSTPYVAQYHGINGAYGGAFAGGRTLVGELGNELVVNPHSGKWYTVGDNGAEFVNLPKDAIVFDHSKTKKLLDQGFIGGRGVALASGTAMDSGSPGRGSYVGGNGYKVGQDPRVKSTYKATTASTKATKDNSKALEENKKALEKQKTALEKQKDALEKESNKLKIYGQAAINEIEKREKALNKEKEAQDKVYENQIKELEKRKEALQKANDEEDRAIKLAELQDALEKAKANRTVRIYNKNEGFVWRADQQAVSDAQNDLDDQKRQWKNDDILQTVDDEIERINNLKDAYDESIEAQIDDLDNMKEKWDEVISLIGTSWEDYQAQLAAAAEFNGMSLDGMAGALDGYKDDVIANMKVIGDTSAEIDRVTEAIDAFEEASSKSGGSDSGGSDAPESFGIDDGSTIGDGLFDGLSDSAKAAKEELDKLLERYEDLGDRNEGLSESQLALVDSISQMTVGTKEYSMANMELSDIQSIVGDRYTEMGDLAEQYRESVLTNNELTWEQKDALLSSFDEIVASYSTGYDTIDGLMQNYMDTLVSNTELSTADYQAQMDALVAFADQHGVSYDSIIQYLYNTEEELRNTGATTEEISSAMSSAVSAACSAMNASYDSVIAKLVELKKQQSAMNAVKGAAGGINANTVARYATGVIGAATTHIAITDEQGPEIKMRKPSAGNYSLIERGSSVIPAQPSANIWKMGLDPEQFISQHMPQRSIKSVEITQPDAGGVSVSVGDIQMYGVNDVESFGRVIHERVGTIFAQEFSRR